MIAHFVTQCQNYSTLLSRLVATYKNIKQRVENLANFSGMLGRDDIIYICILQTPN